MREPNHNFPLQNRASVCITAQLYDRRALDGPVSTLPLISSLSHLAYLTSTSPRIREILTLDGGLERLVSIVISCLKVADRDPTSQSAKLGSITQGGPFPSFVSYSKKSQLQLSAQSTPLPAINKLTPRSNISGATAYSRALLITYTLSLQSLVNVGVRGSESVRTRVVEAGVLTVAASVLKGYLSEREVQLAQTALDHRRSLRILRRESSTPATLRIRTSEPALPISSAPVSPMQAHPTNFVPALSHVPPLSNRSSNVPSRVNTPDSFAVQGSSTGAFLSVNEDGAVTSSEDGELDQEREEIPDITDDLTNTHQVPVGGQETQHAESEGVVSAESALSSRGRERSATLKSLSHPAADEDETMEVSVVHHATSQDMEIDAPENPSHILSDADGPSPAPTLVQTLSADLARQPTPTNETAILSNPNSTANASSESLKFRDEDVLLCLQLLAYLSKYPHIRAVFHDPSTAHNCSQNLARAEPPSAVSDKCNNIFSLVERFTINPNDHRSVLTTFNRTDTQKKMLNEIHYWAGVIMRNACRKDEARGGIRQCANMFCGAWESYPKEFAKCKRCRKAKYCSKSCQKRAWHGGHRFWCSARDADTRQERNADLAAADAAILARFIEQHPEVANNPDALSELARRLRHIHARNLDAAEQNDRRSRQRHRAHAMPDEPLDPLRPQGTFFLRPAFNEDEDAEDEFVHPDELQQDANVEIAGVDDAHGSMIRRDVDILQ